MFLVYKRSGDKLLDPKPAQRGADLLAGLGIFCKAANWKAGLTS